MHLHSTTLERYLDGSLDERTRAALDSHVANCLPCAETVAEADGRDVAWVRRGPLGRLVRVRLN
jgi:anti-sigma factor RsiW